MPANLTPDYLAAEQALKRAETQQERIAALEEMLATLPKHKGTEKLQADIRRRLSQARKESQKKGGAHSSPMYFVRREGAGQVVLLGPPNSGKSSLLAALTHAHPEIAAYPFTTRMPLPGMMRFEDVSIQLVDTPAMSHDFTEPWMSQVVKHGDLWVLVVDPDDPDVLGETEWILTTVDSWRCPPPALLAANKLDAADAADNFAALQDLYRGRFSCLGVSALTGAGLAEFRREVFRLLNVIRFYSKAPGKKPDLAVPYILRRGATVQDAAGLVHRDFAEHLHHARLFRKDHAQDGRMVERTHVVDDCDILEFHAG